MKGIYIMLFCALAACNNATNIKDKAAQTQAAQMMSAQSTAVDMAAETDDQKDLKNVKIDNQNDPVCGMPLRRGFEDTAMYNGKVIGFCSKECKDDFEKKPNAYKVK